MLDTSVNAILLTHITNTPYLVQGRIAGVHFANQMTKLEITMGIGRPLIVPWPAGGAADILRCEHNRVVCKTDDRHFSRRR